MVDDDEAEPAEAPLGGAAAELQAEARLAGIDQRGTLAGRLGHDEIVSVARAFPAWFCAQLFDRGLVDRRHPIATVLKHKSRPVEGPDLFKHSMHVVVECCGVPSAELAALCAEREALVTALAATQGVQVYPSAANFLLLRITRTDLTGSDVFERLLARKVLVKNVGKMHALLENCLRITVSTPAENALFLAALQSSLNP